MPFVAALLCKEQLRNSAAVSLLVHCTHWDDRQNSHIMLSTVEWKEGMPNVVCWISVICERSLAHFSYCEMEISLRGRESSRRNLASCFTLWCCSQLMQRVSYKGAATSVFTPLPPSPRLRCIQDDRQKSKIKARSHTARQHALMQRHCHRCWTRFS